MEGQVVFCLPQVSTYVYAMICRTHCRVHAEKKMIEYIRANFEVNEKEVEKVQSARQLKWP